ncbi:hypothetical protein LCGC14_2480350 [marine sediment metagenome]|uniref:Uncharacterized protein n=1 Tax=marine sediment metagenome TaxID=412755 RepID=A0A0F9E1G2_9ZZZZ
MAGTPEEDLLAWLEREEQRLGFADIDDAMSDISEARRLFFDELGYDMTDSQFAGLKDAIFTRYDELPTIGISYGRIEHTWGYQTTYRDITTGRFVSRADVFSLLSTIR